MNEIGVEVNGSESGNVQNVDVHYWKHKVTTSILDGNNVLVSGIYEAFLMFSCC
jgi:sporulation protein YlmC with PRC-barrel domain